MCLLVASAPITRAEESEASSTKTNLMKMSLDELLDIQVDKVYGASKYEQTVSQAPSSVTIVTADDIKKQGHRTLPRTSASVR